MSKKHILGLLCVLFSFFFFEAQVLGQNQPRLLYLDADASWDNFNEDQKKAWISYITSTLANYVQGCEERTAQQYEAAEENLPQFFAGRWDQVVHAAINVRNWDEVRGVITLAREVAFCYTQHLSEKGMGAPRVPKRAEEQPQPMIRKIVVPKKPYALEEPTRQEKQLTDFVRKRLKENDSNKTWDLDTCLDIAFSHFHVLRHAARAPRPQGHGGWHRF